MKRLLITLLLLLPLTAAAATPEESYLAARDAYIAKFKQSDEAGSVDEAVVKAEAAARAELEKQLQRIIGKVEIKGMPAPRSLNLETLFSGEMGFGQLDGLKSTSADDKILALVTTEGLLKNWIKAHKDWWPEQKNVPQDVDAALKSEAFYTQAVSSDAAVSHYAELPVSKPAGATSTYAMLAVRQQDVGPATPNELIVGVVHGGRAYVLTAAVEATIPTLPACDAIWKQYEARAEKAQAAYQASEPKDEKLFADYAKLQEEGDAAFRRCFAERAPKEAFFKTVASQAQTLVDSLPAR